MHRDPFTGEVINSAHTEALKRSTPALAWTLTAAGDVTAGTLTAMDYLPKKTWIPVVVGAICLIGTFSPMARSVDRDAAAIEAQQDN